MTQPFQRLDVGDLSCFALRGAAEDPIIRLSDLLLPPDGDESKRSASERTATVHGVHSCLLVRTEGRHVLIDGGLDSAVVRAAINAVGVDEDDLDLVLITHGDTDHIAGLVDRHLDLVYRNANYVLPRGLWEAWISDGQHGDPNPFYSDEQRAIAKVLGAQIEDRVALFDGDSEIETGIRAIAVHGHRPSHVTYELTGGKQRLLHAGDAFIAPILVDAPSRGNASDSDPAEGIRSRLALLRRAARPNTTTYVPHFPFPGFIRIVEHETQFSWEAW